MTFQERIKEIEENLRHGYGDDEYQSGNPDDDMAWLLEKLKEAVRVIEFYGNEKNFDDHGADFPGELGETSIDSDGDYELIGFRARVFLEGLEKC